MRRTDEPKDPDRPVDAGRADAVSRLFVEHNSTLTRFLRLRLHSDQDAKEVAQEAYVRLLQLDEPGAVSFLRAYLFRIASNLATDRLRSAAVRQSSHADPIFELAETELPPDRAVAARQQLGLVEEALAQLPDHVRTAFLLHRLDGMATRDIGVRLGVTERSALNYVVKAMVHCRAALDRANLETKGSIE